MHCLWPILWSFLSQLRVLIIYGVKKTSNIQVVEIQITLEDGHHHVNYNEIHEN